MLDDVFTGCGVGSGKQAVLASDSLSHLPVSKVSSLSRISFLTLSKSGRYISPEQNKLKCKKIKRAGPIVSKQTVWASDSLGTYR